MAFRYIFTRHISRFIKRRNYCSAASECKGEGSKKGLVLGVYYDEESCEHTLTDAGDRLDQNTCGKLTDLIKEGLPITKGKAAVYQNLDPEFNCVAVAGLGPENVGYNALENIDECKENIRIAAAVGTKKIQELGINTIYIEGMGNCESAAEGASLAAFQFQEFKKKDTQSPPVQLELHHDRDKEGWKRGLFKAEAQNLARTLSIVPGNHMTPTVFAHHCVDLLCSCGLVVEIRDKFWIETKRLNAFLAVARGSVELPVFLEINHCGGPQEECPIIIIGKGVTFDSGGINIKRCPGMSEYRGEMASAAVVIAVMRAIASINLPTNVVALVPLCEHLPSGMSMKTCDILTTMGGKTIQVDNTDYEGPILIADATTYGMQQYRPRMIIHICSGVNDTTEAIGESASPVFTNNEDIWLQVSSASAVTGDRVWRFPLWKFFTERVTNIPSADVTNVGKGPEGMTCKTASFLWEFVPCLDFLYFDISNTGLLSTWEDFPYYETCSMTGRPTRTIIQLLYQMICSEVRKRKVQQVCKA